jgi:hypothetical protein
MVGVECRKLDVDDVWMVWDDGQEMCGGGFTGRRKRPPDDGRMGL